MTYIDLSHIKYDRDDSYIMEMVWDVWVVDKDHLGEESLDFIKDDWMTDRVRLTIPQKEWSRIVVTHL